MADGSRHSLYSVKEVTYGETPASPPLDLVRITGTTLGLAKDSLQSEEIRSDRQVSDFRLGANQVGGDINFELSYGSFDQFLEAALVSDPWTGGPTTGTTTLGATATGYDRVAGSFVTDGFEVGMLVSAAGYVGAGYNGLSVVTAVTALTLDTTPLYGGVHGVEAGGGDEVITGATYIDAGVTRSSFTFVRQFADIVPPGKPFYIYRGVEINTMSLSINPNAIITGTFSVIGQSQELADDLTGLGTPTFPPPSTTAPLDSFTGSLDAGGVPIAVVTEMSISLENGIEPRFVVGSKNSIYPSILTSNLTGQLTAYFEDSSLVEIFLNETETSINFELPDGAGNIQRYRIPRVKYTGGQPDVTGKGPITLSIPFQALLDSTLGTNIRIERLPAP